MQLFNLIDNKQRRIWITLQGERICFKSQSDERSAASVISVLRRSHYRKASASTGTDRGECEVAVTVHLVSVLRRATVPPAPFRNVHPPPSHIS